MKSTVLHDIEHTYKAEFATYICESPDRAPATHFHKNFEMLAVLRGVCHCTVGDKSYRLTEGEAIFILPFQIHSFRVEAGAAVRCTTFHEQIILTLSQTLDGKLPRTPVFRPAPETLRFFLSRMELLFGSDSGALKRITPPAKRIKVKGLLYLVESEFLEQTELIATRGTEAVTMTVIRYVEQNFRSNITLQDVATATGYSYQYLSRAFNQALGISFKQLLNQYRIEYAFSALQDTDLPITQIAYDSGFQSLRAFHHVWQETFQRTPKQVRGDHRVL